MTPDPWCTAARHGDRAVHYWSGCRCTAARAAEATYRGAQLGYERLQPTPGVRRRLQALAAIGWPAPNLAARLGVSEQQVQRWRGREATAYAATLARVSDLYDDLSMTPGPSNITRQRARLAGWVAPLCWGDDIDDPDARPTTAPAHQVNEFPIGPLTEILTAREVMDDGSATWRSYHRAVIRGHCSAATADKMAIGLLGLHPALVWGDAWWTEDVAA